MQTTSTEIVIKSMEAPPSDPSAPASGGVADPGSVDPSSIFDAIAALPQTGDTTLLLLLVLTAAAALAVAITIFALIRAQRGDG